MAPKTLITQYKMGYAIIYPSKLIKVIKFEVK